jgi:alpha-amylase
VIDKLDYLEELGVTALWISPVVKNVEDDAGFASYHGYWTQDFLRPNAHFGDLTKLRELVDKAHERDIK